MNEFNRRGMLALLAGSVGATQFRTSAAVAAVPSIVTFGDSYTASYNYGFPNWVDQLKIRGVVNPLVNLAVGGSTVAGSGGTKTFDGQVDSWIAKHKSRGIPDRTIVYFGYNDVKTNNPLPKTAYSLNVRRLVDEGVTSNGRKLLLCQLHDWSRNPGTTVNVRRRVQEWNQYIRSVASSYPNCLVVFLYSTFEDLFLKPGRYGFTNVTRANASLSSTTHLYYNLGHFGTKGERLIANKILARLA